MAVYKRSYSGYGGRITPRRTRFLVLTRYSARGLFKSRIMTGLFILSLFCPLFFITALYLNHNAHLLNLLKLPAADHFVDVDGKLFMGLMSFQGSFAFLITAFVGPGLIAPDLTNNALPLYFCRPLSRTEYVLGRACVIAFLLSFVTWIPGAIIFAVQCSLSEGWGGQHLRILAGILVGSIMWIVILTLLALALSAWVRWKLVAGGLLLGVMFATSAFAAAIEGVMDSSAGFYLDPAAMVAVIYANFFDVSMHADIGTWEASLALVAMSAFCIWLLSKRIPRIPGGPVMAANQQVVFDNVSKFYGDVLGVNRITLSIPPGITSLVGPNGSGKTTLMNLMTGLLQPSRGHISVLGVSPDHPEQLFRQLGYCTQFDSFPRGFTGYQFVYSFLRIYGCTHAEAEEFAWRAIDRVNMREAAHRKIAAYSKGMRQRIKLAQSTCHGPSVLILDEPLNGLDPLVRAEVIALLRSLAEEGMHIIISSHVLHEVDMISDQVILLSNGYVVAEGKIRGVRNELDERPMQILIRCNHPNLLASKVFEQSSVVEARMHADGKGLLVKTRDPDKFYLQLNKIAMNGIGIETVTPADDDVNSLYEYLIGGQEDTQK